MDIAIFGGGIAGLMTAITLTSSGHKVHVYERSPQSYEAGMGFILVPECIECLQSFGISLAGMALDRYCYRDAAGPVLHEQTMPSGSRAIRRRDLIAALARPLAGNDI